MFEEIILVGNLGKNPEMRYTPSGQAVTTFSIAVNRKYTNNAGASVEETKWFRCVTWGKAAEACNQYLGKGSKVLVTGRLICDMKTGSPKIWFDEHKEARTSFELNCEKVRFLSSRLSEDHENRLVEKEVVSEAPESEEIPF